MLMFLKGFARSSPIFVHYGIQHSIDQDTIETVGNGTQEDKSWKRQMDGRRWKREFVGKKQTGEEKGDGRKEGNREPGGRRTELTGKRGVMVVKKVGVWNRRGKIRVKKVCLLWQSPRPSVLPCSTSCSKADLQGTKTSWSAAENRPGHAGLTHLAQEQSHVEKKIHPPKIAHVGTQYKLQKVLCWLEIKEHLGKCPGDQNQWKSRQVVKSLYRTCCQECWKEKKKICILKSRVALKSSLTFCIIVLSWQVRGVITNNQLA